MYGLIIEWINNKPSKRLMSDLEKIGFDRITDTFFKTADDSLAPVIQLNRILCGYGDYCEELYIVRVTECSNIIDKISDLDLSA